jgi:hypothetical protein
MRFIREQIGQAEHLHLVDEPLEGRGRGFRHRQAAALDLFEALGFAAQLAARIKLEPHATAGQFLELPLQCNMPW